MRLCDIMTHDVNEWITRGLARGLSPATVNRETNLLSSVFNYAVKDRKWIPVNPCHGARRPERGTARNRPLLTPIEIEAVLVATGYRTDPELYTLTARVGACFLLSLETGMRSGEILRLRPSDYWRDKRTAHVAAIDAGGRKAARSGRASGDPGRNVPLTEHAMTVLDQLLLHMPDDQEPKPGFAHPPYIVGMNDGQRDALWRKARDRAGVADLHFHDTKHEAATRLARFLDVLALSHAIGTKNLRLLRDTYYANDATSTAMLLPKRLSSFHSA
jgi:integrase